MPEPCIRNNTWLCTVQDGYERYRALRWLPSMQQAIDAVEVNL